MLGRARRLAILAEGCFTPLDAKTAVGVIRYRGDQVAAVIDRTRAGRTAQSCAGVGGDIPVVADIAAAVAAGADSLLIGTAPQGGGLTGAWRPILEAALDRGWDVLSGLHVFLADDPELAARARAGGAKILDVRRPPAGRDIGAARAATLEALTVLTVGTDCNVGKMTAALEIERALAARGTRTRFVATGQTGIFIADHGVPVDAIPADFVAGAVERAVIDTARGGEVDVVLVEGQGSLHHPGYSGVTLALLHGAAPAAMVLCHDVARDRIRITGGPAEGLPIPSLAAAREAYERAAAWVRPAPVIGVALNTRTLDEATAHAACERAAAELGVPATDPVRFGAEPLAAAVLAQAARHGSRSSIERAPCG
jgi:uncharacterized NAD-dependent epimerase/dehydratase family protein